MSSKDVAALTLQLETSVNQARSRIRKKLGLEGEDNLVDFLSTI